MPTTTPTPEQPMTRRESWPDEVIVTAWHDPVVEQAAGATATASDDTLMWWSNTLGPSAVLLARHLAIYATDGAVVTWPLADLGLTVGISRSVVAHTLDRLTRFGVITRRGDMVAVRLMLPPLTERQWVRLPAYLADAYRP